MPDSTDTLPTLAQFGGTRALTATPIVATPRWGGSST